MTINEYCERFFGLPVVELRSGQVITRQDVVYRLTQAPGGRRTQRQLLDEFLGRVDVDKLRALIIGSWDPDYADTPREYLDGLVEHCLPKLRALFVGDMTREDAEISWIDQTDYSRLIDAYPGLKVLRIRGSSGLRLPARQYRGLRELGIEAAGLPSSVVKSIEASSLPQLQKLELWLGDPDQGFDGELSTDRSLLERIRPQRLTYLGLRNAHIADEIAMYLAQQEWLGSLHTLDLSMGTIGDDGAAALCESPHIRGLKVLDLRHHFISARLVRRLQLLPLTVVIDKRQKPSGSHRYVEIRE